MEKKKVDLSAVAAEAGKNAKAFWGRAKDTIVNIADQNDDGTLDLKDVSVIADAIGNAAKETATNAIINVGEKHRELERKLLQPIFLEDLDSADFLISKLIRVTEVDKRHAESDVCRGAIGFVSDQKDLRIVNIYKDNIDAFGLSFYPDTDYELYYVDPSDRDKYIALDEYFNYLKVARVTELQKIAQDLGAKHFRVTYKEKKTSFSGNTAKAKVSAKYVGDSAAMDAERDLASTSAATVEIAAEMDCPGHVPKEPKLCYLQRDPSIKSLIDLRMDKDSPTSHQKYTIMFSNSSGIKEKDAVKIDAALKGMKIAGNTTVTSEVRNESRRFFEFEIDF